MYLFKNKISIEHREKLEKFLDTYPHRTSGLTFSSLYMWRDINKFSWEIIDDFLCISGCSNFEGFEEEPFIFPLLPQEGHCHPGKLRAALANVIMRFREEGCPFVMRLIPEHMVDSYKGAFPGKMIFIQDRPNYDYVYKVEELNSLSGRRFHRKKNLVHAFNREYAGRYEIKPMSADMAEEAIILLRYIDGKKAVDGFEKDMLDMEEKVLSDILPKFDQLGMEGIALYIDGKLQAYAFGGRLGNDTIVEHIEKGNIDFKGIYQKINNEFCKSILGKYTYVNREEDMGLEGLRHAKTSYRPCTMIEKYIAMMADDKEAILRYSNVDPLLNDMDMSKLVNL